VYQDELCDEVVDEELPKPELESSEPEFETTANASVSATATATTSMPTTSCSKSSRKRRQDFDAQYSKTMESLQQLIKSRTEKQKVATPDDEDDVFGKMVACECRKISNSRVKRQLKKKINDLLYEAADEDEASKEQVLQYFVLQSNDTLSEQ